MNQVHHLNHKFSTSPSMTTTTTTTITEPANNVDENQTQNELKDKPTNNFSNYFTSKSFVFKIDPQWTENSKSAFAVILYGTVSLCQTIFNKKVMTTYQFNGSNVLLFCQMLVSIVILHFLKYVKVLNFQTTIDSKVIKKLMPLSLCYVINVLLGLDSLKALNIPMYSALKRLVAVIILVMEYLILNKVSPPRVVMSVFVMVLGAIVAGVTDLTFNALGYTLVLTSCFFQATYLVYVKKTARDMSTYDMLYYNSALSLPFITILMLYFEEVPYFLSFEHLHDPMFQIYFLLSVFIGFLLNFCIFFCTSVNSALTTSVTGQIKNIVSTVIGAIIFKDVIIHPINIFGLFINMIGSIWYSALKLGS